MLTNFVALTAGLATTASAFSCSGNYFSFYNRNGPALSYQRLDPALYPGTQSPHLHSFDGGNGLSATTDFEQTQASSCSTARIKTDKSLYWRPSLFWNGNGTGFHRVPEASTKIYYKFGDGDKWANVTDFPEDFNMIAGSPMKRSDGDNPAGIRWACHGDTSIFTNGFPKGFQSCKNGFATEVTFPSCWNGQKLDPKQPNAHMAYANGTSGVGIENCPTTHRAARFPTIFIEFWYDVSSFDGTYSANSVPWVLSNGDPTGFGFHADFLNGWEKGVLAKAIAETGGCNCGCGCGETEMQQCFGTANVNKDEDADFKACSIMSASSNDAAPVLDTLPGCNPIQSGPADATAVTGSNCAATAVPVSGGSSSSAASSAGVSKTSAISSPTVTPSAKASSTVSSEVSSKAASDSSKVVKDDAATKLSLSLSFPNKQYATPTPAASSQQYGDSPSSETQSVKSDTPKSDLPSLSLASTPAAVKPSSSASVGKGDEDCKAPVYVTVTPTIYVTAGVNATSCNSGTVTKTFTKTATVTVAAASGLGYESY